MSGVVRTNGHITMEAGGGGGGGREIQRRGKYHLLAGGERKIGSGDFA